LISLISGSHGLKKSYLLHNPPFFLMEFLAKTFIAKGESGRGDPLSPLLFVLAAKLVHHVLNKAATRSTLEFPLQLSHSSDFLVIQYADDTILVLKASQRQLLCLKGILQAFTQSTGLNVNHAKSCLLPINIDEEKATQMAGVFGYQVGTYPFTYLGLPMGTTKPRVEDFSPLVSKIERISATIYWLSMAGRATWVDSAVSSIPIYSLCSVKMHVTNLNSIDRARKHGLWRGSDVAGKGKPLLAWEKVTAPKDKGGLGLKNLRIMNEALLIKHFHKFYNKEDIPWVQLIWNTHYTNGQVPHASLEKGSFWFRDIMKFCDHFRGIASANVGRGDTTLLWQDVWNGHHLKSELPRIYSYARNRKISVSLLQHLRCSPALPHTHLKAGYPRTNHSIPNCQPSPSQQSRQR
jgi:hypothetical protein